MAYRIKGVIRLADNGDANLGLTTATEFDGKVSKKAITEQTSGDVDDVTGADELLIYDQQSDSLLRVSVDDFMSASGVGTIVTDFDQLNVTGVVTAGGGFDGNLTGNSTGLHNGDVYSRTGAEIVLEVPLDTGTGELKANVTGETVSVSSSITSPDFYGNVEGNVVGNTTGNHNGDVYSRSGEQLVLEVPTTTGTAIYTGIVTGDVTGDLTGNSFGTHTGQTNGDVYTADGGQQVVDTAASPAPIFKGDAEGLTGDPNISVTNVSAGSSVTANAFYGNGSSITGVTADSLVSIDDIGDVDVPNPGIGSALIWNGTNWIAEQATNISPSGALVLRYRYSSNNTMADPGAGFIRTNTTNQYQSTSIAVDVDTRGPFGAFGGSNMANFLMRAVKGTRLILQRNNDPSQVTLYSVNVDPVQQGTAESGWISFPDVTSLFSTEENIPNQQDCMLAISYPNQLENTIISPSHVNTPTIQVTATSGIGMTVTSDVSIGGSVTAADFYGTNSSVTNTLTVNAITTIDDSIKIGKAAGSNETVDGGNIFIGLNAGEGALTATRSTFVGKTAGFGADGDGNTYIGADTASANTGQTAVSNTAIGAAALNKIESGGSNVVAGVAAGNRVSTGNANTLIGASAGEFVTTGSNNIVIGGGSNTGATDVSNHIVIGNNTASPATLGDHLTIGNGTSSWIQGTPDFNITTGLIRNNGLDYQYIDPVSGNRNLYRVANHVYTNLTLDTAAGATLLVTFDLSQFTSFDVQVKWSSNDGTRGFDRVDFIWDGSNIVGTVPATSSAFNFNQLRAEVLFQGTNGANTNLPFYTATGSTLGVLFQSNAGPSVISNTVISFDAETFPPAP